jgi:hypothetical protein
MLNLLIRMHDRKRRKADRIAQQEVLKTTVIWNIIQDCHYEKFPKITSLKERIVHGDTRFTIMAGMNLDAHVSIIIREAGVHLGALVYHVDRQRFAVRSLGDGITEETLYDRAMILVEIDAQRRRQLEAA